MSYIFIFMGTNISVDADGPCYAALCIIDNIALHAECNNQATSDICIMRLKLHLVDLLIAYMYYMNKFATNSQQIELMELEHHSCLLPYV